MTVDTIPYVAGTTADDLGEWLPAELQDLPLGDGSILRALICRLGAGKWQWSISSLDGESGELICTGVERTSARARQTVASELTKCLENAIA
jgi:hypothetical protein